MRLIRNLCRKVRSAFHRMKSKFDALGSYTGAPKDTSQGQKPEQDADDL